MFSDQNKLKFLNGIAFLGLKQLTEIWLLGNECIDKHFIFFKTVPTMTKITRDCGFANDEHLMSSLIIPNIKMSIDLDLI